MNVPQKQAAKQAYFLPIMAECFSTHGFGGTTTAVIAKACGVPQNVLYRIWPTKEAMFVAVIKHIHVFTIQLWNDTNPKVGETKAEAIIKFQSEDHGTLRYYMVIYSSLLQSSPEIRAATRKLYCGVHRYLTQVIKQHRDERNLSGCRYTASEAAWGLIGAAAVADVQRELNVESQAKRKSFLRKAAFESFLS